MLTGQDWEPVVFHKRTTKQDVRSPEAIKAALRSGKGIETLQKDTHREERDRLRKIENEEGSLPILAPPLRQRMIQARVAKKMNQTQLAQACNLRVQIIQDLETGKPVADSGVLQKIMRVLGQDLKLRF